MDMQMNDELDLIIALVGKDCGQDDIDDFDGIDTSEVTFSKRFYRRKARILKRYRRKPCHLRFRKGCVRVAIALLVLMAVGFTTIMALPLFRNAVFEAAVEWYERYLAVRYETFDDAEPSEPLKPILPDEIIEFRKPMLLPQGVTEKVVHHSINIFCIDYYRNGELVGTFNQTLLVGNERYVDNLSAIVDTVDINGNEGIVVQHTEILETTIVWDDDQYIYQIDATALDMDELVALCRSVP